MADTDARIRQILEESKQKTAKIPQGAASRSSKIGEFEKKYWEQQAKEQAARETAVKRGLQSWVTDIPGYVADLAVDVPYNLAQRAAGRRGENIKPLGYGERVRSGLSQALGFTQPQAETGMQPSNEDLNEITDAIALANPLAFTALGDPLAVAKVAGKGAKALGREAGRRVNEALLTGEGPLGAILAPVAPMGVVKGPGGNWLPESTKALEGLRLKSVNNTDPATQLKALEQKYGKEGMEEVLRSGMYPNIREQVAINDWIDKQLTRYVKNQMATPDDPIRALAEKGTLHFNAPRVEPDTRLDAKRQAFADKNNGRWGYGEGQLAQNWEDAADKMINAVPAETYQNFGSSNMTGKPGWEWINKVDPETPLYGLNNGVTGAGGRDPSVSSLGFNHIIDELRNATNPASGLPRELLIKPESLSKLSVPQAVERVAKINEWRAAQQAEANMARAMNPATALHKEYPEGYSWYELKQPEGAENASALEDALKYEGETMGHCVGGYCPDVASGRSRIYSLRDKKGQPHVTVETRPQNEKGYYNSLPPEERHKLLEDAMAYKRTVDPDWDESNSPNERAIMLKEYLDAHGIQPLSSIVQIKGKQNRAPNAEYLPFVQDFVRSGKWSNVGDIQNTGLLRKGDFIDEFTPEQLDAAGVGEYLTADELGKLRGEGMKRGGAVKARDCNQDAMNLAVMDKAVKKNVGGVLKGFGRSKEEAKRLYEIAQASRSKAAQEAAGLYHPIGGGVKLSKPIELMEFETVNDPSIKKVKRKVITPESLQGGIAIPLVGDRAAAGKLLKSVEGTTFEKPVVLEGGGEYMLTHTLRKSPKRSSIWASDPAVISKLRKQIEFARETGSPIYGVNVVGSPTMVNFNTMLSEALLNQYDPTALTKKAKEEFLKDIRNYAPDASKPHIKPGSVLTEADLNDVEALRAKMLAPGSAELRKAFAGRMGMPPFQEAGFPNVSASRLAITDPRLVDVPLGSAGFTIGEFDPAARALEKTARKHTTYPTGLAGEYVGSLEAPVDYRNFFQEFGDKRRAFGKAESSDWRSFSLAPQYQTLDQEWLDRLMKEMGANKPREWKKGGKVDRKAPGGLAKKALNKAAKFVDAPTTKLEDWAWRPFVDVRQDVPITEIPDYIQKGYGQFMQEQMAKARAQNLTDRDLLKAYLITQSSIGRGGLSHATATKAGMKLPNLGEEVRPEGAFATWLGSKEGQKYLDDASKGIVNQKAIEDVRAKFAPFGKQNDLADTMAYAVQMAPAMSKSLNQAITGPVGDYRDFAEQLTGIAASKSGFIGSLLGRGDLPTFDARQINLHTKGMPLPTQSPSSILARGKGLGGREAVDRQIARQKAMELSIDPALDPYYQHLGHHAVWDALGNVQTTHQDLIDAMRNYVAGGLVKKKAAPKKTKVESGLKK